MLISSSGTSWKKKKEEKKNEEKNAGAGSARAARHTGGLPGTSQPSADRAAPRAHRSGRLAAKIDGFGFLTTLYEQR